MELVYLTLVRTRPILTVVGGMDVQKGNQFHDRFGWAERLLSLSPVRVFALLEP